MHHSRTRDFNPLLSTFERLRLHVGFEAGFGERKIVRTKPHSGIGAKKLTKEKLQSAFQVCDTDVFIDIETFDLMELRAVRRVDFIATHSAQFHQIEGLYVDENVSIADKM